MERGWVAEGRLEPLWKRVGGRDELARLSGIAGNTLSSYNSGKRPIGMTNAKRVVDALRNEGVHVSLYDLGATRPYPSDFAASMLGQAVQEIQRNPPAEPGLLEELASELDQLARALRAVATSSADDELHAQQGSNP